MNWITFEGLWRFDVKDRQIKQIQHSEIHIRAKKKGEVTFGLLFTSGDKLFIINVFFLLWHGTNLSNM